MKKVIKFFIFSFFAAFMTIFYGCNKANEIPINTIPNLTTTDVSGITINSAVAGGNITWDGGIEITARGVCWSLNQYPTTEDAKTADGIGSGSFTSNLTVLNPGTTYFIRAYAINSSGITYGNQLNFTTQATSDLPGQATGDLPGKIRYFGAASFSIGNKVYIVIGNNGDLPKKDFWEWDQTTNIWTRKAGYPGNSSGVAVSFSIGAKGYIGFGNDIIDGLTNEFWEYDPSIDSWTQKTSLPTPRSRGMAVGFSIGTKGYIGTGYKDSYTDSAYPGQTYQDFWEWDQVTNTWTQKADFRGIARYGAVGFSIGNKGYIGIGSGDGNILNDFWEWDQATNVWTRKADFGGISRLSAVGFSIGDKGYIGTGTDDGSTLYNDFWEWDQATNVWTRKADFGGNARGGALGFSIGNKGYIGAGATGSRIIDYSFQDFWEWDQATNLWIKKTLFLDRK